jgi:hypothetical protein
VRILAGKAAFVMSSYSIRVAPQERFIVVEAKKRLPKGGMSSSPRGPVPLFPALSPVGLVNVPRPQVPGSRPTFLTLQDHHGSLGGLGHPTQVIAASRIGILA